MKKFNITGMSCAACSARVEKVVSAVSGVESCSVNLLTNSMTVEGSADTETIIAAVEAAGYGASLDEAQNELSARRASGAEKEEKTLIFRLVSSVAILTALMYISMGYAMWGWYLPAFIGRNPLTVAVIEAVLSAAVMVINRKFFINGVKGVIHKAPNMDTLVALGSGAAFGYSIFAIFKMATELSLGNADAASHLLHDLYFESAAMILALITVGKMLEARAKGKTTDALESLMKLSPKTATVVRDGKEVVIPTQNVRVGDIFLVRPGENIPVDGIVTDGHCAVDEAALTGESLPVDKAKGAKVFSGTLNKSGVIYAIATVATAVWLIAGESFGFALARGISVLVISCPCALGLATPVAIMVGTGRGAKNGILFKTATSLEETGRIKTVALDKTGTITSGHPAVTDIIPNDGISQDELLRLAVSLEKNSEHPLANAVCDEAQNKNIFPSNVKDFEIFPGNGLVCTLDDKSLVGGNLRFISNFVEIPEKAQKSAKLLSGEGKTPLFFAYNEELVGIIAVADTLKPDSAEAIKELRKMGIKTVMLTGDNERTAKVIGEQIGVDEVISGVLPDGKEEVIKTLQKQGRVAMVGDGINDAPALTRADVGIAIGAGTDIAIDAADVVLMKSRLSDVPAAIRLSRKTLTNIRENLFWAFFYNAIGIPLAAGVMIPLLGIKLTPMFGAAAMSLSSFCVVTNALRLNFVKLSSNKDNKNEKEIRQMEKIIKVEGMMCPHCEMHVKKALEALDGVEQATASHKDGTVVVKLSSDIADAVLKATVEAEGYKVLGI